MTQANTVFYANKQDASLERVTVAHYSAEEVIQHFLALFASFDFKAELTELGIGRLQLRRRKKAVRELKALCIALWGLALQKSFPNDAEAFFSTFRATAHFLANKSKEAAFLQSRISIYVDLLAPTKDADFLPLATYLTEVLNLSAEDARSLRLKLSLNMRSLYQLIFNRLV